MKLPLEGKWLALAASLAVLLAGALLLAVKHVRLPAPPPVAITQPRPGGIGIARMSTSGSPEQFQEQALLDPDPLFLPTPYNASQPELPADMRREPGTTASPQPPKYTYGVTATVIFPEIVSLPEHPVESLSYGRRQHAYDVLGRFQRTEPPLPARLAFLEVVETTSGKIIHATPLPLPPEGMSLLAAIDWSPLELLAAIDVTGLIGTPSLVRGSGLETVDGYFRNYLAGQYHLGERLPPGIYALRIGP